MIWGIGRLGWVEVKPKIPLWEGCINVCILNWPLPIGAFQDQYKQTMINEFSNDKDKNPNWQEADQLAIYKRSQEVELGATENNFS